MNVLYAIVAFLLSTLCVTSVSAKSPSDTYLAYIKAVKRSTSWEDLLPLLTSKNAGPIRAMPIEQRIGLCWALLACRSRKTEAF